MITCRDLNFTPVSYRCSGCKESFHCYQMHEPYGLKRGWRIDRAGEFDGPFWEITFREKLDRFVR